MKKRKEKVKQGFWVEYPYPGQFFIVRGKSNASYSNDWQFFERFSGAKNYVLECMKMDHISLFLGKLALQKLKGRDL